MCACGSHLGWDANDLLAKLLTRQFGGIGATEQYGGASRTRRRYRRKIRGYTPAISRPPEFP